MTLHAAVASQAGGGGCRSALRRTLYRMFSHTSGVSAEECGVEEHEVPSEKEGGKPVEKKGESVETEAEHTRL